MTMNLQRQNRLMQIIAVIFLFCQFTPVTSHAKPEQASIGTNLSPIKDWSSELVFNDLFKRARPWISNNNKQLPLDNAGWVTHLTLGQAATTYLLTNFTGHFPGYEYICYFEGDGSISFPESEIILSKPGELHIRLSETAKHLVLRINATTSKNYIRNIRIYPKASAQGATFRSPFLKRWREFSTLRFMDWMATNNSKARYWKDRPLPSDFSQATRKGVALEHMIELANRLQVSPWFCMPHQANDDYIRRFAMLVKKNLDPKLKVYIEYSNEVWNGLFKQSHYAIDQGVKLNLNNKRNKYLAGHRYYSQRSVEIFKIWEDVYKGHDKLVRVLSGQTWVPWIAQQILDWRNAYKHADVYAIAAYFGGRVNNKISNINKVTPSTLYPMLWLELSDLNKLIIQHKSITIQRNLDLVAYESGQHLVARNNPELDALYSKVNRSPEMIRVYQSFLKEWFNLGGSLLMNFSSVVRNSKYGKFGVLEWYDQPTQNTKYSTILKKQKSLVRSASPKLPL